MDALDDRDTFAAAYLRFDATLTLTSGPYRADAPESRAAYPAREVAAAIARLRGVRGVSRRPPALAASDHRTTLNELDAWNDRRWRWSEEGREIIIGFHARPGASAPGADAAEIIWDASPLTARCFVEDVARLALALARRLPALRLRLADGRSYTPAEFITQVAQPRLAPAVTSDDPATRAQASEAQARYARALADAPACQDPDVAFAAAPFTVLCEDAALLAVNKPAGVVTHPTYKHPDGTLTDAVFAWQATRGLPRPWLLHRIDKDTSGVVLFARSEQARRSLSSQFERHTAHKRYLALLVWPPTLATQIGEEREIDAPLARDPLDRRRIVVAPEGQPSRTRYRLLATAPGVPGYALALAEPVTGRTHQIRAHFAALGAPLVGDATYLPTDSPARELAHRAMLHAWRLDVRYPGSDAPWSVSAPPPADFVAAAEALGLGAGLRNTLTSDGATAEET